jgi:hypothetical protein
MGLFIAKTKRLECLYGPKGILQLMKSSLVRLLLHHTRRHRTDHLLLYFYVTSAMIPCAPADVAPPSVLRQNWKTLARLASRRSKPPDVDACPHTVFIYSSVLRYKPTNLLPIGFEAQNKKPSTLVLMPKLRNCRDDFEAQITKPSTLVLRIKPRNRRSGFEAKPSPSVLRLN